MKIDYTNPMSFFGHREARKFRQESRKVLKDINKMEHQFDYYAPDELKDDSIQSRLHNVLFNIVPTVGKKYASNADEKTLDELKKTYIRFEGRQNSWNPFLGKNFVGEINNKDVENMHF